MGHEPQNLRHLLPLLGYSSVPDSRPSMLSPPPSSTLRCTLSLCYIRKKKSTFFYFKWGSMTIDNYHIQKSRNSKHNWLISKEQKEDVPPMLSREWGTGPCPVLFEVSCAQFIHISSSPSPPRLLQSLWALILSFLGNGPLASMLYWHFYFLSV
jgi:hypothetical protein